VPLVGRQLGRNLAGETVRLRAERGAFLVDGIQGLSDQLAFGQEGTQPGRVRDLGGRLAALQARLGSFGGLTGVLDNLLARGLASLALLVVATPLVRAGVLDGVNLAVVMLAAAASFGAVVPLAQAAQHLEGSREAGRRLFEILDAGQPAASSGDARRRRGAPQPMSICQPFARPSLTAATQNPRSSSRVSRFAGFRRRAARWRGSVSALTKASGWPSSGRAGQVSPR
jgi:ABC-type transport system involved in cytochrome bd biosynthesis fused ATPase/permease subunit